MNLREIKTIEQMEALIASGEIDTFSKAIKAKCLDCSGYEKSEWDNCPNEKTCPLWAFRKGRRKKIVKKFSYVKKKYDICRTVIN